MFLIFAFFGLLFLALAYFNMSPNKNIFEDASFACIAISFIFGIVFSIIEVPRT